MAEDGVMPTDSDTGSSSKQFFAYVLAALEQNNIQFASNMLVMIFRPGWMENGKIYVGADDEIYRRAEVCHHSVALWGEMAPQVDPEHIQTVANFLREHGWGI